MASPEQSVILAADHLHQTAALLDVYCRNACAYFEDYYALLGSAVAMRKALELMGAYYLRYFTKKHILVRSGVDVFHGKYMLPQGTELLFERMKVLSLGAVTPSGRTLPGLSSMLHYQGYSYDAEGDQIAHERESISMAHKLFLSLFPEFQSVLREFCQLANIDKQAWPDLSKALDLFCDLSLTFPLLQNVETQLCMTFDEYPQNGWLEWHARILLKYDTNEAQDELLTDHTIMVCCRSIAEKVMYTCACRAKPAYAEEIRKQKNYALDRYITDYRNCPTPRTYDAQEAKNKDLSRAMTIRSYADANLHWVDRSLDRSMLRFNDLHESRAVLINWQKMIQCGSELVRSVILSDQPRSIARLIERYYDRAALKIADDAEADHAADAAVAGEEPVAVQNDLFDKIAQRIHDNHSPDVPGWIAEKKKAQRAQTTSAAPSKDTEEEHRVVRLAEQAGSEHLVIPLCKQRSRDEATEESDFAVVDPPNLETFAFEVKELLVENSDENLLYLLPLKSRVEWRGACARRTFLFPKPFDPTRGLNFLLLSIPEDGNGKLNTAVIVDGKFYVSNNPTDTTPVLVPGLFANPNDLEMEKLKGLGFSTVSGATAQTRQPTQPLQTYVSDYSPHKLTYMFLDQDAKEIITPQVFMERNNQLKIKITLNVTHKHFILDLSPIGADIHYNLGEAYCLGSSGLKRNMIKAANEFHQVLFEHPNDKETCYELGCLFRYVEKIRDDASALEYLGISAERGHAGGRYEWAKMILEGRYPDEQRVQAAKYLLELIQCGYRQCGTERLTAYLPLVVPIAEQELVKQREAEDENALYLMADLSSAYKLMGRDEDARLLMGRVIEQFERCGDHLSEPMLALANTLDAYLVKQQQWDSVARLRAVVRDFPLKLLLDKHRDDDRALLEQLEKLDKTYSEQNRYGDRMAVLKKMVELYQSPFLLDEEELLETQQKLGAVLARVGRGAETLEIDQMVLEKRRKQAYCEPSQLGVAMGNLAYSYWAIGRLDDAIALRQEAIDLYECQCGDEPYRAWRAKSRLAQVLETAGDAEQAKDILTQVLANFESEYGPTDADVFGTRRMLAWNAHIRGRNEESLALYRELLEQMRPEYEPDEHLSLQVAWDEVRVLHAAGHITEAYARLQALTPILSCAYGEDSPMVADARALMESMAKAMPSDIG